MSTQEVSDSDEQGARAIDTICAGKPALTDLAQQLAALSPEDRKTMAAILVSE